MIGDWYGLLVRARTIQRQIGLLSGLDHYSSYIIWLRSSYSCFPSSTNRSNRFLHVPLPPSSISPSKVYLISTEVNAFKRNISHRSPRRFDSSPIDLHSVSFNVVTKYALRVNLRNRKANKLIGSALNWVNVSSYQLVRMSKWRAISNRKWGHNDPWKLFLFIATWSLSKTGVLLPIKIIS